MFLRKHYTLIVFAAALVISAPPLFAAEPIVVQFCHPDDTGALRGGPIVIDPNDTASLETYGYLDEPALRGTWAVTTVLDNGPTDNRVDIVLVGDGYTANDLDDYEAHVNNVVGLFFAQEPLDAYQTFYNVHRVDVISNETGVDEPDLGIFRDTALNMTYNCGGVERALCVGVFLALGAANQAPDRDQTLALANSSRYGGVGYPGNNLGTLAGANGSAVEIALHEFGHAFANLADEYDYDGPTNWPSGEPNSTNLSIFNATQMDSMQTKWYRWLDLPNVDTFEGGGYSQLGIYRPTSNSKMRALFRPFEEVNAEQFLIYIYSIVDPIDGVSPPTGPTYVPATVFTVDPVTPTDHDLDVTWLVDGSPVPGETDTSFSPASVGLSPGNHTLAVRVVDNTTRVRDESVRDSLMTSSRSWLVAAILADYDGDGDVDLSDFAEFSLCFGGANQPPAASCPPGVDADFDDDGDVDLSDFATFSLEFTGSL